MYGPFDPNNQEPTTHVPQVSRHRGRRPMPAPLVLGLTITGLLTVLGAGAVLLPTSVTGSGVAADPAVHTAAVGRAELLAPAGHAVDPTVTGQPEPGIPGAPADRADPAPTKTAAKPDSPAKSKKTAKTTAKRAKAPRRDSAPRAPRQAGTLEEQENRVIEILNARRREAGCGAVRMNEKLRTAMRRHVQDMAQNHYFSHTSRNGDQPWDRARAAGYDTSRGGSIGENIAKGQRTPEAVMDGWMNSSDHRRNIENCGFKEIGVGLAYEGNTPIWGQLFGSR